MRITSGQIPTAKKIVVYGPEGIGKSTFASRFPRPVFIDTEGSTSHMDVARFDPPKDWNGLIEIVDWCIQNSGEMGTLVIDTVDWAEPMAFQAVISSKKSADIKSIEDIPYGKGYVMAKELFMILLKKLDMLKDKGVNVVLVCHAIVRKFEQPDELGSYDRYTLKLNDKNISPLIREWSDMLLFANYVTDVVKDSDGKTKKAKGGKKRVMYTAHSACWDAKNRFGLDDPLPFEFDAIAHLFQPVEAKPEPTPEPAPEPAKKPAAKATVTKSAAVPKKKAAERPDSMRDPEDKVKDALLQKVWDQMQAGDVTDPCVIQKVVADRGYYEAHVMIKDYSADFIEGCLVEAWDSVLKLAQTEQYNLPF